MSLIRGTSKPDDGTPDATLVDRARRGDPDAFAALVRRHFKKAYTVALALLSNGMDAEDVCQDAFLKALERLDDCREPDKFASWLLQIVRNRAHNFRDYRRVRAAVSIELTGVAGPEDASDEAVQADLRTRLGRALGRLSDIQRQVVLLHDLEGLKHREIAERIEISEGMSRQHLFNARKTLREILGPTALKEHLHE
ncbi:MAG: RNA polymerase sigma factor [Gemmatimonadetes bacterium]|nr:RNA polymerase sigma factor [Gemmatimonadota bacterium]